MADGSHILNLLNTPVHSVTVEQLEQLVDHPATGDALRTICKRVINRAYRLRLEAPNGVCFSGMGDDPRTLPTLAELGAEAAETEARINSPRCRFVVALAGAEEIDPSRVSDIRGLWCRDLADDRQPLNVAAVGAALVLLNAIPGKAARAAIDALACLLMNTSGKAV